MHAIHHSAPQSATSAMNSITGIAPSPRTMMRVATTRASPMTTADSAASHRQANLMLTVGVCQIA